MTERTSPDSGNARERAFQIFSIDNPEETAETTRCQRHTIEMETEVEAVETDGALYTTGNGFKGLYCPKCRAEYVAAYGEKALRDSLIKLLNWAFIKWDKGKAEGEWFIYVCEIDAEDPGGESQVDSEGVTE